MTVHSVHEVSSFSGAESLESDTCRSFSFVCSLTEGSLTRHLLQGETLHSSPHHITNIDIRLRLCCHSQNIIKCRVFTVK